MWIDWWINNLQINEYSFLYFIINKVLNFYQPSTENPPILKMDKTENKDQPKVEASEVKPEEELKESEVEKT